VTVWKELEERLKEKASKGIDIHIDVDLTYWDWEKLGGDWLLSKYKKVAEEKWVRLEDALEVLRLLKQRVGKVIDQYIRAYPLDTPEDKKVSKVLEAIRGELL